MKIFYELVHSWGYYRIFFLLWIISASIYAINVYKLGRYISINHPNKWEQMKDADFIIELLDFIWKSKQNFGDPQIDLLRKKANISSTVTIIIIPVIGIVFSSVFR